MKKVVDSVAALVLPALLFAAVCLAVFKANQGVENLVVLFVWAFLLPSAFLGLSNDAVKRNVQRGLSPKVVVWLNRTINCATVVVMAWSGWMATAVVMLASMAFAFASRDLAKTMISIQKRDEEIRRRSDEISRQLAEEMRNSGGVS